MYGYRARIGYAGPMMCQEVIPYEFYKMVPPGVTLVMASLDLVESTLEEVQSSVQRSIRALECMARMGVKVAVWGGGPILLAQGAKLDEQVQRFQRDSGLQLVTTMGASVKAFRALKSRRIASVSPHYPIPGSPGQGSGESPIQKAGFQMVGSKDIPAKGLIELGGLPSQMSMDTARELLREHPETDTLYFGGPHRPIADKIEEMEREFKVNVVTSLQAVVWEGLRYSGITEPIRGYGKLLRAH